MADAEALALGRQPRHQRRRRGRRRRPRRPTAASRSDQAHVVAAGGGHAGRLEPGRPAPDDENGAAARRRARSSPGPPTRDRSTARPTHVTIGLRASRTWHVWLQRMHGPDALGVAGGQLGHEVGIGDLGAGHLDAVAHAVDDGLLGGGRVDDRPLQEHGDAGRHRRPHGPAHVEVEHRRLVDVGPGLLDREDRAPHDDEVVDEGGQRGGDAGRLLGRDAGPRSQLVARQAQTRRRRRAPPPGPPPARRGRSAVRSWPHSSPRWLVRPDRNWRTRLCWPALTSTPSQPAATARAAASPKPAITAAMSSSSIHFGTSRELTSGTRDGAHSSPLAVRRRALAAGVAEGGDHDGAVVVGGGGDGPPPGARSRWRGATARTASRSGARWLPR